MTPDFFAVLGVPARLGRTLLRTDTSGPKPVVMSHELWQSHFGGDASILGRTILLDETAHTVVGVMPPRFEFPARGNSFWVPLVFDPDALDVTSPGRTRAADRSHVPQAARGQEETPGPRLGKVIATRSKYVFVDLGGNSLNYVTVSRRHAEFHRQGETFTVTDVGSLNGTYVNRDRIDTVQLTDSDEVQIGKYRLVFFSGHEIR